MLRILTAASAMALLSACATTELDPIDACLGHLVDGIAAATPHTDDTNHRLAGLAVEKFKDFA